MSRSLNHKRLHHPFGLSLPFGLGLALLFLFGLARLAQADAIPNPESIGGDGRNVQPTDITHIQMVSETVLMEVSTINFPFEGAPDYQLWGAHVTIDFLFNNPSAQIESMPVGFPLFLSSLARHFYPEIVGLRAFVEGTEAATREKDISSRPWSIWDMSFPPGNTLLRVTYDVPAVSFQPGARLKYILHTGAAWADSIGQGDLIVRFPYPAEETFINPKSTLPGYQASGNELHWHFENLDPTEADDLIVTFVHPDDWRNVLTARKAVGADASASNYWTLAKAYADIVSECDPEATEGSVWSFCSPLLGQIAQAQYLKAMALEPGNPDLRQEYQRYLTGQAGRSLPTDISAALTQIPTFSALLETPSPAFTQPAPSPDIATAKEFTPTPALQPVPSTPTIGVSTSPKRQTIPWLPVIIFITAFVVIVGGLAWLRVRGFFGSQR